MSALQTTALTIEADVRAAQRGDHQAFTRLVEATCSLVSSIALAIVRDPDLSRDIAQDVFVSAWRDIGKLREPASFLPWLRQVTRNRAYHVLRGRRRGQQHLDDRAADDLLAAAVDPRPDAQQQLISLETRRVVADTLDLLPDEAREVVTLFYREGQSVSQVADLLDLSEAAVRQRLSRARAKLRSAVLERFGEELAASAPGAAFVAGVTAALTAAAPVAATAATIGFTSGKSMSLLSKIVALLGGAALGAAGGVAGVVFGLRHVMRRARDDEERAALRRFQRVAVAVVVVAAVGMQVAFVLTHSRWAPIAVFAAFIASLGWLYQVRLPRILRRRFEAEMREDPVAATRRRQRERFWAIVGWTLGLLCGTAGLIAGLWSVS